MAISVLASATVVLGLHYDKIAELFTEPSELVQVLAVIGAIFAVVGVLLILLERGIEARRKNGKMVSVLEVFLFGAVMFDVVVWAGGLVLTYIYAGMGGTAELLKELPGTATVTFFILVGLVFGVDAVLADCISRGLAARSQNEEMLSDGKDDSEEQGNRDGGEKLDIKMLCVPYTNKTQERIEAFRRNHFALRDGWWEKGEMIGAERIPFPGSRIEGVFGERENLINKPIKPSVVKITAVQPDSEILKEMKDDGSEPLKNSIEYKGQEITLYYFSNEELREYFARADFWGINGLIDSLSNNLKIEKRRLQKEYLNDIKRFLADRRFEEILGGQKLTFADLEERIMIKELERMQVSVSAIRKENIRWNRSSSKIREYYWEAKVMCDKDNRDGGNDSGEGAAYDGGLSGNAVSYVETEQQQASVLGAVLSFLLTVSMRAWNAFMLLPRRAVILVKPGSKGIVASTLGMPNVISAADILFNQSFGPGEVTNGDIPTDGGNAARVFLTDAATTELLAPESDGRKALDSLLAQRMGWNEQKVEVFVNGVRGLSALVNEKTELDLGPHDFYIVAYPYEWTFMTGRMGKGIITMSLNLGGRPADTVIEAVAYLVLHEKGHAISFVNKTVNIAADRETKENEAERIGRKLAEVLGHEYLSKYRKGFAAINGFSDQNGGTASGNSSEKSSVRFAGSENDSGSMSRAFNNDGGIRAGPRGSVEYYAVNLAAIFIISGLIAYFVSVYSAQGLVASFGLSSLLGFAAAISVLYLVINHISPNKEHGAPLEQAILKLRPDASSALIARVIRLMNGRTEQRHSAILSPLNLFKLAPIVGPALRAMERNRILQIILSAVKWVGDVLTMLVIYRFLLKHILTPLGLASDANSVSLTDAQMEELIVAAENQLRARRSASTLQRAAYSAWDIFTAQFILDFSNEQIAAIGARRAVSGDLVRKTALLAPLAFFIGVNALFSLARQRIVIGLASMFAADYILKLLPLSMHAAMNAPLVTIKFSWLYLPISDLPVTGSLILSSFIIILVLDLILIRNTVKEEKLTWSQKAARIVNMLVSGTVSMIFVGPEIEFAINFTSGMPVAGDTVRFMEEFVYGANGKEGLGQIIINGVNASSVSSFGVNPHKDVYNFIAGHNPFFASPDFDSASAFDQLYNLRNRKAAETGAEQELGLINSLISEAENSELTAVAALGQYYTSEEKWLGDARKAGYGRDEMIAKRDELLALIGAESKEGKDQAVEEARGIFTRDEEKFGLVAEGLRNYYAAHEDRNAVELLVLDGAGLDSEKALAFNSTVSRSFFGAINDRQLLEDYAETAVWNMFDGTAAGEEKAAEALKALPDSKAEEYIAGFASAAVASGDYARLAQARNASISANVTLSDPEKEVWLGEPDSDKVAEMSADITAIAGVSGDPVIGEETVEFGLKALYYDNPNVFDNALLSIAQNNYKEGTVQAVNSSNAIYDSVKNINSSKKNYLFYSVYQWQYDQADIIKEQLNNSDYTGAAENLNAIQKVDPKQAKAIQSIVISSLLWGDQAYETGLQSFDQAGLNKLLNFTTALNSTGSDVMDAAGIEEHNKTSRNAISSTVLGFMKWSLEIQAKMLSPVEWLVSKIASRNDNGSAEVAVMPGISVAGALAGALEAERNETAKEDETVIPWSMSIDPDAMKLELPEARSERV
ncbi:MAG: hypothetical protein PHE11_05030, partial [Candidatus Omnitrophica bacterium]|nr:hypothetical protein [Candidatus Omnitrophota bacterium]